MRSGRVERALGKGEPIPLKFRLASDVFDRRAEKEEKKCLFDGKKGNDYGRQRSPGGSPAARPNRERGAGPE